MSEQRPSAPDAAEQTRRPERGDHDPLAGEHLMFFETGPWDEAGLTTLECGLDGPAPPHHARPAPGRAR